MRPIYRTCVTPVVHRRLFPIPCRAILAPCSSVPPHPATPSPSRASTSAPGSTATAAFYPTTTLTNSALKTAPSKYDLSNLDPLHPHTIVAADGNRGNVVVGFATTAASHEPDLPHHGELTALYVDPDRWGLGIGGALVSAARAHLVSLGRRQAYLFTLVGNLRAQRFYQSDLWSTDGLRRAETVWNIPVDVLRFQRNL